MRRHRRLGLAYGLAALVLALGACTGEDGGGPDARETTGGTGCADTVTIALEADRGPIDDTFVARGGGAYVDADGDLHVVFGSQAFDLGGAQPEDLVSVAMLVPLDGEAPEAREYTSGRDGVNLDVSRRDQDRSITSSFGLEGTGDEVTLEITELGDDHLCASVLASSLPETGRLLHLAGTIEVPYGPLEDDR